MDNTSKILSLIKSKGATILMGNGYNRYILEKLKDKPSCAVPPSWEKLVKDVDKELQIGLIKDDETNSLGITNPELFTAISLAYDSIHGKAKHSILPIHKAVARILEKRVPSDSESRMISQLSKVIKEWGAPIITTNYDKQLENSLGFNQYRLETCPKTSSFYPVNLYYGDKPIKEESIDRYFAIWHCNGVIDIVNSLRLDMSDYCNYTAWLKRCVPMFGATIDNEPLFKNSWLYPLFNNQVIILGLSLIPSEFFLRWLLIRRFIWRKEFLGASRHGYYICGREDNISKGQRLFFSSAGIEVLEYDTRAQIYSDLFKI